MIPWERLRVPLVAGGIFLLLLSAYLLTCGGDVFISDGWFMYQTTEAIVDHHTLAVAEPPQPNWQAIRGRDGKYFSIYGLGQPLVAAIPFVLAQRVGPVAFPYMQLEDLEYYSVTLLNQFVTALTGMLVFLLAYRLGNSLRLASFVALAWGLSTLAWPYSKVYFSEPLFTLCLVIAAFGLLAYAQSEGRGRFGWAALAGLALGYAVLTRVAGTVLLPAFLGYAFWAATSHPEGEPLRYLWRRVRRAAVTRMAPADHWPRSAGAALLSFGLPLIACGVLLLWYNWTRFESPFNNGYSDQTFHVTSLPLGLAGLLLSPGKSIFLYVPLTMLAVVAWPRFWRASRPTAAFSTAVIGITLLETSMWWGWTGGACWGPRFLVPTLPFLILGLGPLLRESRTARLLPGRWRSLEPRLRCWGHWLISTPTFNSTAPRTRSATSTSTRHSRRSWGTRAFCSTVSSSAS